MRRKDGWSPKTESGLQACYGNPRASGDFYIPSLRGSGRRATLAADDACLVLGLVLAHEAERERALTTNDNPVSQTASEEAFFMP